MALINCKECGKEISDTVKKCPNCGYINKKSDNKIKRFILKHIKIIIVIIIVIAVTISGIIIHNINKKERAEQQKIQEEIESNTLNEDEKMVARVVKRYKNMLKNPDSMQIFEIRLYTLTDSYVVIMDSSGQNGFGGNTRSRVGYSVSSDGKIEYMGDDSKANRTVTSYTKATEYAEIIMGQLIQDYWTEDETEHKRIVIDKDKLLRNLDQVD